MTGSTETYPFTKVTGGGSSTPTITTYADLTNYLMLEITDDGNGSVTFDITGISGTAKGTVTMTGGVPTSITVTDSDITDISATETYDLTVTGTTISFTDDNSLTYEFEEGTGSSTITAEAQSSMATAAYAGSVLTITKTATGKLELEILDVTTTPGTSTSLVEAATSSVATLPIALLPLSKTYTFKVSAVDTSFSGVSVGDSLTVVVDLDAGTNGTVTIGSDVWDIQ